MKKKILGIVWSFIIVLSMAITVMGEPYGPDAISRDVDERRTEFGGGSAIQVDAQAGNVTQLTLNTTVLTKRWQGYYGNISGTITLDDATGYTLYDWSAGSDISVVGEIYAANDTITDWTDIICVNLTGTGTLATDGVNATMLENTFGMLSTDSDGFDETFLKTQDITVGTTTLAGCPATNMYVNNETQNAIWNESLLTENATGVVIFATEVENDANGFNNKTWDFQMIVADDGDNSAVTPYQFYVELVQVNFFIRTNENQKL